MGTSLEASPELSDQFAFDSFPNLNRLCLRQFSVTSTVLDSLSRVSHLTALVLRRVNFTGRNTQLLKALPINLRELSLSYCYFEFESDLNMLCGFTDLELLSADILPLKMRTPEVRFILPFARPVWDVVKI